MSQSVTVGLDGAPESRAAATWAAHEAMIREVPLSLVRVVDMAADADPYEHQHERQASQVIIDEVADDLAMRFPQLSTSGRVLAGPPAGVLCDLSEETALLVLGSRGLSSLSGFVVGSTALATVAHATCPVVLIRGPVEEPQDRDRHPEGLPPAVEQRVVLALDLGRPCDELLEFAFQSAARHAAPLRVLHAWQLPPAYGAAPTCPVGMDRTEDLQNETNAELTAVLRPWHEKFPEVNLTARAILCRPSEMLVEAASAASLLVIGRRTRRAAAGTHLGHVAHAAIHHVHTPLAIVAHE